tara:strand:- start:232 stop:972 length:741 start_codon:yes stop_codon:yes gene_type:complete
MGRVVIGVDEAGRGPVIGPLIVCAVEIPESDKNILEKIGVDDSKRLSKNKRSLIYDLIIKYSKKREWKISIIICSSSRIDLERQESNLNNLEVELFAEAIDAIGNTNQNREIRVDACDTNQERFGKSIKSKLGVEWSDCDIISEHKMDEMDIIVGAASIIAKITRDREIKLIESGIGFDIGSGYPSDPLTKNAVKKMISGKDIHPHLRWSWATVERAWNEIYDAPLPLRRQTNVTPNQTSSEKCSE